MSHHGGARDRRAPDREREIFGNVLSLGLAVQRGFGLLVLIAVAEVAYAGDPDVRRAMLS